MKSIRTSLLCALPVLALIAGFDRTTGAAGVVATQPDSIGDVVDAPLAGYQAELLDLAFEVASAMPTNPHIKNRSRAQYAVVTTCFELDQPRRALGYVEKIDNWLRGSGYADYAFVCAQRGDTSQAQRYLELAAQIAQREQDWRRDQVRVKIARTYALLGDSVRAAEFEAGVVDSESGKVAVFEASRCDDASFQKQLDALDEVVVRNNLDQTKNALDAYAELFNRFYGNADRRLAVEGRIKTAWTTTPVPIRFDVAMSLANFALKHADKDKALSLANEARALIQQFEWLPEQHVALLGRVAELRARAGAVEDARKETHAAQALFDSERERIMSMDRASALRPIAEAYAAMGDRAATLAAYRKAVDEGAVNPNARPRADDLSATCCSMAMRKVEPDAGLWDRLRQIGKGLSDPW